MKQSKVLIALDVGEKRVGVARADGDVRIAVPLMAIVVDGSELDVIDRIMTEEGADAVVIGYPRNQSGETTAQTSFVEAFAKRLSERSPIPQIFQDESLTSVHAEERLKAHNKPFTKGDIDAQAAALILQDYLEKPGEK